ncbi:MAG: DNA polymerase III subunit beta [Candidatus Paceibacterota bacterium]|jgi:DNA polymerase-3 subunit beta
MKLECQIEKLKLAINQTDRVTGKNLSLPILNSILLIASGSSLKLRATNLSLGVEVEIPAKVEKEGVAAIQGNVLNNLFSSMNQSQAVTLELKDENLLITTKQHRLLVKNYPPDDFPTIPLVSGESFSIPVKKFIDGIQSVFYSSSVSDIKPEISSVYIYPEDDYLVFVATDSFRLAEKKVKVSKKIDFSGILIPFKNISEIIRIFNETEDDIKIEFNKNQISISAKNVYATSRLIDGIFPDYKQIIPKNHTTEAVLLKQDFLNALKISNIFSDKFNQINFSLKPKSKIFEIFSKNSDVGENKTSIEGALSGDDVELSFNYKYILDCFQSITSDSVSLLFNGPQKPMIIRGVSDQSYMYLVMPMNR